MTQPPTKNPRDILPCNFSRPFEAASRIKVNRNTEPYAGAAVARHVVQPDRREIKIWLL